jgi:hypothetical protein
MQRGGSNDKFLVHLVQSLTNRHLFFLFWGVIVAAFVLLIVNYYRSTMRRNFKEDNFPPPRRSQPPLPAERPRPGATGVDRTPKR